MRRRTTITVETTTVIVVRHGPAQRGWCPQCAADAEMVAMGDISGLPAAGQLAVERWLAESKVHRIDRPVGGSLICLASLLLASFHPNPAARRETLPSRAHLSGAEPDEQERS